MHLAIEQCASNDSNQAQVTQFIPIEHEFDHPQQLRGDFPALPRIDYAVQFNSFVQLFRFRLKNSVDGKRDGGAVLVQYN